LHTFSRTLKNVRFFCLRLRPASAAAAPGGFLFSLRLPERDTLCPMRFRHSAGFGKRIEFWIIGEMLKEGLDVYVPLVDDNAIDAVVRRMDGTFLEVQIKARSKTVTSGDGALFAAIPHESRSGYWFVFYSERMDVKWIMTSAEFIAESYQNRTGKNAGLRSIWFNGKRRDKATGTVGEHVLPQFAKYVATDFSRLGGT
jgi:hypothetical protein